MKTNARYQFKHSLFAFVKNASSHTIFAEKESLEVEPVTRVLNNFAQVIFEACQSLRTNDLKTESLNFFSFMFKPFFFSSKFHLKCNGPRWGQCGLSGHLLDDKNWLPESMYKRRKRREKRTWVSEINGCSSSGERRAQRGQ